MARVDNPKHEIAGGAVSYIRNQLRDGVNDFQHELDLNTRFSAAYIGSRDGSAKTHIDNAIRMLRWIYETEFGLSPPVPFTDGDVDGININIRTFEDGA